MYERDCVSVYSLLHVDAFQFTDASKSLALAYLSLALLFSLRYFVSVNARVEKLCFHSLVAKVIYDGCVWLVRLKQQKQPPTSHLAIILLLTQLDFNCFACYLYGLIDNTCEWGMQVQPKPAENYDLPLMLMALLVRAYVHISWLDLNQYISNLSHVVFLLILMLTRNQKLKILATVDLNFSINSIENLAHT